jgi:hypothetical protein
MHASVYRLRAQGIKLPRPTQPCAGEVLLDKIDRGDKRIVQARLVEGSRDLLPPLFGATITRVTRNGMVIHGSEMSSRVPGSIKAAITMHRQTWWVVVMCSPMRGIDVLEEMADGDNPLDPPPYPDALPHPH